MFIRFDVIHERDRRTDRRTLHDSKDRVCIASRGKNWQTFRFLSRVSILTRDIDIGILSVRPSVRNVPVSDENGLKTS